MNRLVAALALTGGAVVLGACQSAAAPTVAAPPSAVSVPSATPPSSAAGPRFPEFLKVHVLHTYPHAPDAFTQGLFLHDGVFYESAGLYGKSTLRIVEPRTGKVLREQSVPAQYFAEGLALADSHLIQLTWQEHVAQVYDASTWDKVGELHYDTEGWGLCYDEPSRQLVMSDGSARLFWRRPDDFSVTRVLTVTLAGQPVVRLNELECVGHTIYANIWQTDSLVRIDAASGEVSGAIDGSGLLSPAERSTADVLNGIAYDASTGHFFITGKLWPKMFEVEFVAPERPTGFDPARSSGQGGTP